MSHKLKFKEWAKNTFVQVYNNLSDVVATDKMLEVGDRVIYTNKYGVKFGPLEILGFCKPDGERCIFLDKSSYWFPVRIDEVELIKI